MEGTNSMIKTNYHTHTCFCDGKGTPCEITAEAVKKGFHILGFSGHCALPFGSDWHIQPREIKKYMEEVRAAAEKYREKITVLCGFEADYIQGITKPSIADDYASLKPDFLIGSVHYVLSEKGCLTVDDTARNVMEGIQKVFSGDGKKCVVEYFMAQRKMLEGGGFTIWAHPDLVRKRNGELNFFREDEPWYIDELERTAAAASKAGVIAEINTGAISRGAMDDVYPSETFLKIMKKHSIPVTFSSDAHEKGGLDFAFDRAMKSAYRAGYTETAYIDGDKKIRFQKIQAN